eukprot:gb/GECG01001125.1/.p1 GENE.gb/GECG01001125.1/~~gb/GECG01001125.1/.p1  ORF type:complete len:613 (+),score=83.01 gb/GECG01001125.1/:1-1839(+)
MAEHLDFLPLEPQTQASKEGNASKRRVSMELKPKRNTGKRSRSSRNRTPNSKEKPNQKVAKQNGSGGQHIIFASSSSSDDEDETEDQNIRHGPKYETSGGMASQVEQNQPIPWWNNGGNTRKFKSLPLKSPLLRLHQEILEFVQFIQPTEAEQEVANGALAKICNVIHERHPDADIKIFGSRSTNLLLPSSDWDICVYNLDPTAKAMHSLANSFRRENVASSLEVITKAKVPIIKMKERESEIPIDISFNAASGPESSDFMAECIKTYPAARPLVIVLKYFLQQRGLNETYTGGIGSFLLMLMVVRVIQEVAFENAVGEQHGKGTEKEKSSKKANKKHQQELSSSSNMNLGHLLLRFFELYGFQLNYVSTGISVRGGGAFFEKKARGWYNPNRPELLSIENPMYTSVDVGKNSFSILKVKDAFAYAYHRLATAIREWNGDFSHLRTKRRHAASNMRNTKANKAIKRKSLLALVISQDDTLRSRAEEQASTANRANDCVEGAAEQSTEPDVGADVHTPIESSDSENSPSSGSDSQSLDNDGWDEKHEKSDSMPKETPGASEDDIDSTAQKGQGEAPTPHQTFGRTLRKPRLIQDILANTRHKRARLENPSGWY